MKNLDKIIEAYTRMDDRRRDEAVVRMTRIAVSHPREASEAPRGRPVYLSLVVDNSALMNPSIVERRVHDLRPTVVVCGKI
ncbi:hypothetical protein F2P44_31220 [Massilia sp. CCM 8695]|uniref:Uncharacterized protein n=1 Tax=Massilia frigida TaxID=2609281 RepID=A0ABX0NJU8_9BURK|nr:hypothetical protein [Massilia frigida]